MDSGLEGSSSSSSLKKKRKLPADDVSPEGETSQAPLKVAKIHPFFLPKDKLSKPSTPDGPFQWLDPLGPSKSCLHGTNLQPKASEKVAAFDLDGTLVRQSLHKKEGSTFLWWKGNVPEKLKELHKDGYSIVLISNQHLRSKSLNPWKLKITEIGKAIGTLPFRIFAATERDQYRKPLLGMWQELERIFAEEGVQIDKSKSFFVGDAAGREYPKGKGDFASTDRKWALNVGIPFFTPEEYFLKLAPHTNYTLPGFRPSSLPSLPPVTPTSSPIIPEKRQQETVIFVGYPSLGKTSFFRKYFEPEGYLHINQDTLKTRDKCVLALKKGLEEGKSCVIDNTNADVVTRKYYLDVAKELDVPVRCFNFTGSFDLAWHNNVYRAYNLPPSVAAKEPKRVLVPYPAFTRFRDHYEEPTLPEGFTKMKNVNWNFEGTEEEKRYWSMWLQIDGK